MTSKNTSCHTESLSAKILLRETKPAGISTLEEKALGCTQKCGKSYVSGVMPYGERLQKKGLNLLSAPGNDLVAATTLAASGCHMVLFTTGRGTPFGTFVPTMKISTNSTLAKTNRDGLTSTPV